MNTIFRGVVGAAMLIAGGATTVSAQDYTWTLSNVVFETVYDDVPDLQLGFYPDLGTASGTLVLTKVGIGSYALQSFNFTTTPGASMDGTVYNYAGGATYGTDGGPQFNSFVNVTSNDYAYDFHITWNIPELLAAMNADAWGTNIVLFDYLTSETSNYDFFTRYSATDSCEYAEGACGAPTLTLTHISSVPEPASMAVLGAGLLGLFAARRRRIA